MSDTIMIGAKQLEDILTRIMTSARGMNPMEERKFREEQERDKRRTALMLELGKAEDEARNRRRNSCTHKRHSKTGEAVGRDQLGDWTTGGQAYQDGQAAIFCLRCQTRWIFKPTPEQYSIILQNGLLGATPPLGQVEAS